MTIFTLNAYKDDYDSLRTDTFAWTELILSSGIRLKVLLEPSALTIETLRMYSVTESNSRNCRATPHAGIHGASTRSHLRSVKSRADVYQERYNPGMTR